MARRNETNFAEIFYQIIGSVSSKNWWQFIRRLGLPESEIDEISYDDDNLTEQKYQMLLRWKHMYGYKKEADEIYQCLKSAKEELDGLSPNFLNQTLGGSLHQNRLISIKFYEVIHKIEEPKRRQFVKLKLRLSDVEISSITTDYRKDTDEQFFQMLLAWKRKNRFPRYQELQPAIEKLLDDFKREEGGPARQQANTQPSNIAQPSSDVSYEAQPPSQMHPSDAYEHRY